MILDALHRFLQQGGTDGSFRKWKWKTKLEDCFGIVGLIFLVNNFYLIILLKAEIICLISKKEIYIIIDANFINDI